MTTYHRRQNRESGQAIVLTVLAISIFLMGALGLAVDGSNLYAQRQLAQAAADAAAQAGMMDIFESTGQFTAAAGTTYTCSTATPTPCYYAMTLNSFNTTSDTVTYTPNPSGVSVSGLSPDYTINLLQVTVRRNVPATVMRLLGWTTFPVTASATAAIVAVDSPVPIIVTHPTLSGSFNLGGTGNGFACDGTKESVKVTICGGPSQSIQVNSTSTSAVTSNGGPIIDLSKAGPSATGASFGITGAMTTSQNALVGCSGTAITGCTYLGTTGFYLDPNPAIQDPLSGVTPPSDPSTLTPAGPTNPGQVPLSAGLKGCPASAGASGCTLYFPGTYTSDIDIKNANAVFAPGIYYLTGYNDPKKGWISANFIADSNGNMYYAQGLVDSNTTTTPSVATCCGTGTNWGGTSGGTPSANAGMLVYLTGQPSTCKSGSPCAVGAITVNSNSNVNLVGSPNGSSYKGILFFVDRWAAKQTHSLDGGGGLTLTGTIYTTSNTNSATVYQILQFQGNSGSSTQLTGEVITSTLNLQGTPGLVMNLSNTPAYRIDKVALVQ